MPIRIPGRRAGRPDYSHDVKPKGHVPMLIEHLPRPNVEFKVFELVCSDISSPFVAVRSPLSSGEEVSLIDAMTGLEMPFTIPSGKYFEGKAIEVVGDSPVRITIYFDDMLIAEYILGSHQFFVETLPVRFSTKFIDPEATETHSVEVKIKNLGDKPFYGKCIYEVELVPKVFE